MCASVQAVLEGLVHHASHLCKEDNVISWKV